MTNREKLDIAIKKCFELMEKEKVLETEFVKVWDNWAWRIVKNEKR